MLRVKQFEVPLTDGFYVVVEIELLAGQITRFVVRLMKAGDPDVNIARYDTAHHLPHRDVLGKDKGLLRKDWLHDMSLKDALQFAINDLKLNYERYNQIFEAN
jgi:hypothetical protein